MTTITRTHRRAGALTVALAVAGATLLGGITPASAAAGEPGWDSHIDVAPDYLAETYHLPADHVFETVTFERFEWLLNGKYEDNATPVTGRFAFLVGGAHDESVTSTIGYIDQVAKQYGVDKIYTFDPALDGGSYNIWNTSGLNLDASGKAPIEALGTRLLTYLNADTTPAFTKASTDPYLFIYDKGHTADAGGVPTEDRIVSSLNVRETAASLAAPGAVAAYKAQVASVFDAVAVSGVAHVDELDQFTFWKAEANRRHKVSYGATPATRGDKIIEASDGVKGWRIQTITYPELQRLVQQDGDYLILFGGTWCHNTRAVIKQINAHAQERGITTVYNFDNSLDSTGNAGSNYLHIRDNAYPSSNPGALPSRASYLYGDLWNTYFTNVATEYGSVVKFYPGGDTTKPVQTAQKGQVPFLFEYDKANVVAGASAPVVRQWIQNKSGVYKEYMIDWWQTPTAGVLDGNPTQKAFAAEAETALGTFFAALPGEVVPVVPAAPAAPVASVTGDSVTVTWSAPADGGSAITGYKVSLDGAAGVPVAAGTTTHTFTGVAAGSHTATVIASNAVGASPASAASNAVTVAGPGEPEEPVDPATVKGTVKVTGNLQQGGTITVTGTGFAESTNGFAVEIHSTPQLLGSVGTNGAGAFTFTAKIPSTVPAGSHSIVVLYNGVVVSTAAISVAADPALAATGVDTTSLTSLGIVGLATLALGGLVSAGVGLSRRRQAA